MKYKIIFYIFLATLPLFFVPTAFSEVYIPENEYVGFYDHDGVYTVIAGIKNIYTRGIILKSERISD